MLITKLDMTKVVPGLVRGLEQLAQVMLPAGPPFMRHIRRVSIFGTLADRAGIAKEQAETLVRLA